MHDATIALAGQYAWLALACVALLLACGLWHRARMRRRNVCLQAALNNMSQGLCMWSPLGPVDPVQRALRPDVRPDARPGASGRSHCASCSIIASRSEASPATATSTSPICSAASPRARPSPTYASTKAGSSPSSNRPMGDGGWVATHEDITEQRQAEIQRTSMRELEGRRAIIEDAIAGFPRADRECAQDRERQRPCHGIDCGRPAGFIGADLAARPRRGPGLERSFRQRPDPQPPPPPKCRRRLPRSASSLPAPPKWCARR